MQANDAESAALSHTQWCLKKVTGSSRDTSHLFYFWLGCTSKLTPRRMVMKSIHAKFIPGNVSSSKNGRTCRQTYTQRLLKLQCECCSKVIWNDTLDFYAACIINLEITINWVLVHFLFFSFILVFLQQVWDIRQWGKTAYSTVSHSFVYLF